MKIYKTPQGPVLNIDAQYYALGNACWDQLINTPSLMAHLAARAKELRPQGAELIANVLAPIGSQEVWGAGVTYYRSRDARIEESKSSGGGDFYSRVYEAERPELFFKATPQRVVGLGQKVRIRRDSKWNVPEPELTLAINSNGQIIGYTIGNDMSSRDIEGENPLYLPQAKTYDQSCALGPCIFLTEQPLPPATAISIEITRKGEVVFNGSTTRAQLKREPASLVEFLYRESSFPAGAFLLTGTGIVPPNAFTLLSGDAISIKIDSIGELLNTVL